MPKKGKSYHNFMEKKFYHPTSFRNLERVWMRKQELEAEQKKIQERMISHKRENEEMETRILMGDKKAKLGVAFIYDQPPGMEDHSGSMNMIHDTSNPTAGLGPEIPGKKGIHTKLLGQGPHGTNRHAENQPAQYKFDWQRNAPRAKYLNNSEWVDMLNTVPTDKPFGIEVRNVMCIKCKVWGHCATDRDCPSYGTALKDIPERAIDLAEKRKYLASKYGESLGDDLNEYLSNDSEEEDLKTKTKKQKKELKEMRSKGEVPCGSHQTKLKSHIRSKHEKGTKNYTVIVSSGEEGSSSSSSSDGEDDVIQWTAADREKILRRMQEVENGFKSGSVKKEAKVKKEKKEKKSKKKKKEKKSKKDKEGRKRRKSSGDWEEAKPYRPNLESKRSRYH